MFPPRSPSLLSLQRYAYQYNEPPFTSPRPVSCVQSSSLAGTAGRISSATPVHFCLLPSPWSQSHCQLDHGSILCSHMPPVLKHKQDPVPPFRERTLSSNVMCSKKLLFLFFLFKFYRGIVGLQCCVGFRCTEK